MTIEKAIKGIEIYLSEKKRLAEGLKNEYVKWPDDRLSSLCNTLINAIETDIEFLILLKKQILPSKSDRVCSHPKNMRDKADSVWYCMNCNQDL